MGNKKNAKRRAVKDARAGGRKKQRADDESQNVTTGESANESGVGDSKASSSKQDEHRSQDAKGDSGTAGISQSSSTKQGQKNTKTSHLALQLSRNPANDMEQAHAASLLAKMSGFQPDLSVKEKLELGLRLAARKKEIDDEQRKLNPQTTGTESLNDIVSMGRFDLANLALNLPPGLEPNNAARRIEQMFGKGGAEHILKSAKADEEGSEESNKKLKEHLEKRMPYVQAAASRLQAALSLFNGNAHDILGIAPFRQPGHIMDIEPARRLGWSLKDDDGLCGVLERAALANGSRSISVDKICFNSEVHTSMQSIIGPAIGSSRAGRHNPAPSKTLNTAILITADDHCLIKAYQVDVTERAGATRKWMFFYISKPLTRINGRAPRQLDPMPTSWLMFAIPTDKISQMQTTSVFSKPMTKKESKAAVKPGSFDNGGPSTGQNGAKKLSFKLSKNGIPTFMCSSKKGFMPAVPKFHDFLSVHDMDGISWNDNGQQDENNRARDIWWGQFEMGAAADKRQWMAVQQAMAREECVIDLYVTADWVVREPDPEFRTVSPLSAPRPITDPSRVVGTATMGRARRNAISIGESGRGPEKEAAGIKPSALRNEVQMEDEE